MSVRVRDGSGLRVIKGIRARDGSGVRVIKTGKIRDGSGLRTFFTSGGPFLATPLTADIGITKSTTGANKSFTLPHTLTVGGGTSPYAYAWSKVSGSTVITTGPTNAATITFGATLAPDTVEEATWKCIVTEAGGGSITCFVNVHFNLSFIDIGGTQ